MMLKTTGMNDMNAMFVHEGVFHVTYQDHIDCPDDINQVSDPHLISQWPEPEPEPEHDLTSSSPYPHLILYRPTRASATW